MSERDFSHYRVLERLGGGGMGIVFRARDTRLDRTVALKFLPAEWSHEPLLRERFSREARAASSLDHPHICTIFDIGETPDGQLFIAMAYCPGSTLKQRILEGPLPIDEAVGIAIQIADGLAAAHDAGVVHRDIKPANILTTDQDQVKIVDFGLAKLAGDAAVTREGSVVGTPAYMSPEQASGDDVDGRSDIWAVGAVLYEMLTGRRAFAADHERAVLHAITTSDPTPMDTLRPQVPAEVQRIVRRCLKRDPKRRYQHARELVEDLRRFRGESAPADIVTMTLPSASQSRGPTLRRRRLTPAFATVAAIAVIASISWLALKPRQTVHLAVLPFECGSEDERAVQICRGLMDTLTARLGQLRQFRSTVSVVPMSEIRARSIRSADDARKVFGVDLVLTGSVLREIDQLRVPIQLIDAAELRQIRSHLVTTDLATGFILQDEVVTAVQDLLEIHLAPGAREAMQAGSTSNAEAAELFLEARGTAVATATEEQLSQAMSMYRSALNLDPHYADAMVELADLCHHRYELNRDAIWLEHGVSYAERAANIDPKIPAAHAVAGRCELARGDYDSAVARLQQAIELDPLQLDAYTDLATAYEELGEDELASATIERAIRTGPDDWQTHYTIGRFHLFERNNTELAATAFRRLIDLNPDSAIGYAALGATLFAAGDFDGARTNLERAVDTGELYWALSNLATLEYYEGRHRAAAELFRRALAIDDSDYKVWNNLAEASRASGRDREQISDAYGRAAELARTRLRERPDDTGLLIDLASFAVHLGQPAVARDRLLEAEELGIERVDLLFAAADTYERLGEREQALVWLDRALRAGLPLSTVERYPDFDSLRSDPRFRELLAAHGEPK